MPIDVVIDPFPVLGSGDALMLKIVLTQGKDCSEGATLSAYYSQSKIYCGASRAPAGAEVLIDRGVQKRGDESNTSARSSVQDEPIQPIRWTS